MQVKITLKHKETNKEEIIIIEPLSQNSYINIDYEGNLFEQYTFRGMQREDSTKFLDILKNKDKYLISFLEFVNSEILDIMMFSNDGMYGLDLKILIK